MYNQYQGSKIFIYYTEEEEKFLKWAISFWLLKSPHPICPIKINSHSSPGKNLTLWLNQTLSQKPLKGLYVPIKVKPCVDIDLVLDSHQNNRFGVTKKDLPIICLQNTESFSFELVDITDVFEDLTDQAEDLICSEIKFMQEKLLMNV